MLAKEVVTFPDDHRGMENVLSNAGYTPILYVMCKPVQTTGTLRPYYIVDRECNVSAKEKLMSLILGAVTSAFVTHGPSKCIVLCIQCRSLGQVN